MVDRRQCGMSGLPDFSLIEVRGAAGGGDGADDGGGGGLDAPDDGRGPGGSAVAADDAPGGDGLAAAGGREGVGHGGLEGTNDKWVLIGMHR